MLRTKVPFWWCSHKAQQSTKDYSRRSQSHCLLQQRITHEESVVNLLSFQTSTMSTAPGNIFLTTENLAFSLPLIIVCGTYAFFKFVPLKIGLPVLGGIVLLYQISSGLKAQREKKLTNLDENAINDLAMQLEGEEDTAEADDAAAKKLAKKKAAIQRRLEAEARKETKKGKKQSNDDDDDDVALDTFVKKKK